MYKEAIFYGLQCDRCGDTYESSGDYSYYTDKSDVMDAADGDDWVQIDGRHYCPCCYEDNPDPDHDDDHDYRPKPAYPECVPTLRRFLHVLGGYYQKESNEWLDIRIHTGHMEKDLAPEYRAMIEKIISQTEHSIEVVDLPNASNAEVHIKIKLKRFYKGQRVRMIHHKPYRDAFGKEGEIVSEADPKYGARACYGVHIFDDEDPNPHFVVADDLELIKEQ